MKKIRWIFFIGYCIFIVWYTILNRIPTGKHEAELGLFWSYRIFFSGNPDGKRIVIQNLQNIAFFIPVGVFLPAKNWWTVGLLALSTSLGIEIIQYIGCYGLAELDDVICNVLGAMIGYGITLVIKRNLNFH